MYEIKFKLPRVLGLRSCPFCPGCNEEGKLRPCQDIFGGNTLPMGGCFGLAESYSGANEYQKKNTPHYHAIIHLANAYQHSDMSIIAENIKKGWLDASTVMHATEWVHVESPPDPAQYEAEREGVEEAWKQRFADGKHENLCVLAPNVLANSFGNQWDAGMSPAEATIEGNDFRMNYDKHVQFIFSRVQEHYHRRTKNGRVPLDSCLNSRNKIKCKHGFPKRLLTTCRVVCAGNYKPLKVRISGRRSALGSIVGRRSTEYGSGTARGFAFATGSNTHTAPNWRLPPLEGSHDETCSNMECKSLLERASSPQSKRPTALPSRWEAIPYACALSCARHCGNKSQHG